MRLLLLIGTVVVALVLVVVLIGLALPKAHVATRSIRLRRAPADVWRLVSDVRSAASWRKSLTKVEMLPSSNGRIAWREVEANGAVDYEAVESRAPEGDAGGRFVTRITEENLPFGGGWTIAVDPVSDGTRVTITERGEVYNPVFRFVSRFIMGHTATIDRYLREMATQFGETQQPVDAEPVS